MDQARERRAELLAVADPVELIELADACLAGTDRPRLLRPPEVGYVSTQVSEPIAGQRFLLGDVLACRAEVEHGGARGWAMRLDDDRAATLAAAICDAEAEAGRGHAGAVGALCQRVEQRRAVVDGAEWAQLEPTIVEFEELV